MGSLMYFVKLCWKNVWRNKRRTIITVTAIGFGVMALVWHHNYYDSFYEQLVGNAIRYHSGHLVATEVSNPPGKLPTKVLTNLVPFVQWLKKTEGITSFSPSIVSQSMLSTSHGSVNVLIKGVYPKYESATSGFSGKVIKGNFLQPRDKEKSIVLGSELAEQLQAEVGSKVVALTQGVDGSIGNELFFVSGIFQTNSSSDASLAFIHIGEARRLMSLPAGSFHQIAILLERENLIPRVQGEFQRHFNSKIVAIYPWTEVQKSLMAVMELNKCVNQIIMWIILSIAAMGSMNSILMGLLERKREFGVMISMGTFRAEIVRMVMLETFLMGSAGVVIGNLGGILITTYFHYVGFDLGWLTSEPVVVNGALLQTVSYPDVNLWNSVKVTTAIMTLSMLASWFPIRHVSRLKPVQALRSI